MPLTFPSKRDKHEQIDLIRRLFQAWLFPHTTPDQRQALLTYLTWMKDQTETLTLSCTFESFPERRGARVVIDTTFGPKVPVGAVRLS